MTDSVGKALAVESRAQLIEFLTELAEGARSGSAPVENESSADMIEAAAAWAEGMEKFLGARDVDLSQLSAWTVSALLFSAGLVYE